MIDFLINLSNNKFKMFNFFNILLIIILPCVIVEVKLFESYSLVQTVEDFIKLITYNFILLTAFLIKTMCISFLFNMSLNKIRYYTHTINKLKKHDTNKTVFSIIENTVEENKIIFYLSIILYTVIMLKLLFFV